MGELGEALDALGASQGFEWSSEVLMATNIDAVEVGDNANGQDLIAFTTWSDPQPYRCL